MEAESHHHDIPVRFSGTQRWMTGLTKRTTCDDVIYALLVSTGLHETESTDNFAIFEKWREVERPLSARTKIVKVWSFWGEEQPNVKLSMRSLDDYFLPGESSLYTRSRRRHKRSSRNKERHPRQCKCHSKRSSTECCRLRTMENLVKLVVMQERKIQNVNDRIYETDRLIGKHEARIHLHRVEQNGLDYVQNSYLSSYSSASSSSADGYNFSNLDLEDLKVIFRQSSFQELEEIARACNSLTHVERRILQENTKLQELTTEIEKLTETTDIAAQVELETDAELEKARVQMIRAVTTCVTHEYNERELDRKIDMCLGELAAKTEYMNELHKQLYQLDNRISNTVRPNVFSTGYHNDGECNSSDSSSCTRPVNAQKVCKKEHTDPITDSCLFSNHGTTFNYEKKYYPNSDEGIDREYSGHWTRSIHSGGDIPMDTSKVISLETFELANNTVGLDKAYVYGHIAENAPTLSHHTPEVHKSRESRPIHKSKATQQYMLYNRSRSAERSVSEYRECAPGVSMFETPSNNRRISEEMGQPSCEPMPDPRQFTARSIIDQNGPELGNDSNDHNLVDSSEPGTSFLPNKSSQKVSTPASETQNTDKMQCGGSVSTDHQLKCQQEQQSPGQGSHVTTYTYHEGENGQRKSRGQIFSCDDMPNSRTLVNTTERGKRLDIQPVNVYTLGDRELGIFRSGKTEYSSLFEKNRDISGTKSYANGGVQRADMIEVDKRSPTSTTPFDQVGEREITSSIKFQNHWPADHDLNRRSSSIDSDVYDKKREAAHTDTAANNMVSLLSNYQGKQTNEAPPSRQTTNSQINRQTRIELKQGRLSESSQANTQQGLKDWPKFQHNNHGLKRDLSSSRQQRLVLSDISSSSTSRGDNGTPLYDSSADRAQNIESNSQPQRTTTAQHHNKEALLNSHITTECSNKIGNIESILGQVSSVRVVLPPKSQEVTSSPSNMKTFKPEACMNDANRGALYHIVSNKMNKTKSESSSKQSDNKGDLTVFDSFNKYSIHGGTNGETTKSAELKSPTFHNKESSQSIHSFNSRKQQTSLRNFSYTNGDTYNSHPTQNHHSYQQLSNGLSLAPQCLNKIDRNKINETKLHTEHINCLLTTFVRTTDSQSSNHGRGCTNIGSSTNRLSPSVIFQNSVNQKLDVPGRDYNGDLIETAHVQDSTDSIPIGTDYYSRSRGNFANVNIITNGIAVGDRTKLEDANDSNSDTGLSSMHSDETPNMETLV